MSHTVVHYCPYCGEEDLRPSEAEPGAWECRSCTRVYRVTFVGLLARRKDAS